MPRENAVAASQDGICETGTGELTCRIEARVAHVTLNRPEARNALTLEMKQALARLVPALGADPRVGAVLLCGAGGAFCAGGDTKLMAQQGKPASPEDRKRQLRWEHGIVAALFELEKPTLAALSGPAAGAGFSLALACDLRIAAHSAFVTAAYAKLGLSGDYGGTLWWTRIAGTAVARRLYLLNERIPAEEALALGMVHEVLAPDQLAARTYEVAGTLARYPREVLALVKDNLNRAEDDAGHRRSAFAHEAANQIASAAAIQQRLARGKA